MKVTDLWPDEGDGTEWDSTRTAPWNHKPHKRGVTWRTCRMRVTGCDACIAEMEADGTAAAIRQADALALERARAFPPPDRDFDPLLDSEAGRHALAWREHLAGSYDDGPRQRALNTWRLHMANKKRREQP